MENQKLDKFIEKNTDTFHHFLSDFQEDIRRLVASYRRSNHLMSVEDIISEINFDLVRKSNVFLKHCFEDDTVLDDVLTLQIFKKYAVTFVRNKVKWTHCTRKIQKYNDHKQDFFCFTEEGIKTTFDIATEEHGEIDENFESFDKNDNLKNFFHVVDKYSQLLTAQEKDIIPFLKKGWTHQRIADNFGLTHQAIQQRVANIKEKIISRFNIKSVLADDASGIEKGKNAINDVFAPKSNTFTEKHRNELISFIEKHPKQYTAEEINEILFDNKFHTMQIASSLVRLRLHVLMAKRGSPRELKDKIAQSLREGFSIKKVAKLYDVSLNSVRGVRSILVQKGELKSIPCIKQEIIDKLIRGYTPDYLRKLYKDFSTKKILIMQSKLKLVE